MSERIYVLSWLETDVQNLTRDVRIASELRGRLTPLELASIEKLANQVALLGMRLQRIALERDNSESGRAMKSSLDNLLMLATRLDNGINSYENSQDTPSAEALFDGPLKRTQ